MLEIYQGCIMLPVSLKQIFGESDTAEALEFETEFLSEEKASVINQILKKQFSNLLRKGQLKLSKNTLKFIKKLHGLGVQRIYGQELSKVIPALEQELLSGSGNGEENISVLLKQILKPSQKSAAAKSVGKRYPIIKGGRVVRWATTKENMNFKYNLKSLFLTEENKKLVETETQTGYTNGNEELKYNSPTEQEKTNPGGDVPETVMQDSIDNDVPIADDDVISALEQDNANYGEFDNALED